MLVALNFSETKISHLKTNAEKDATRYLLVLVINSDGQTTPRIATSITPQTKSAHTQTHMHHAVKNKVNLNTTDMFGVDVVIAETRLDKKIQLTSILGVDNEVACRKECDEHTNCGGFAFGTPQNSKKCNLYIEAEKSSGSGGLGGCWGKA